MDILFLILGIVLLVKGADWFVKGASNVAYYFKISPFIVGLTIVAFGTSAPEAAVSITAALRDQSALAYGNIVGSSMANLLLILGISALLGPIMIKDRIIKKEFPFAVFIVALTLGFAYIGIESINRIEGAILLVVFALFVVMLIKSTKRIDYAKTTKRVDHIYLSVTWFLIGLSMVILGGQLTTVYASEIALNIGMSERLVGLSIVAVGTSLPELATIIMSYLKKESDIALGNIIGSNIFNLAFVLGLSAFISPVMLESSMRIDLIVLLLVTMLAYIFSVTGKVLNKLEGSLLVLFYAGYLGIMILIN